MNKAQLKEAVCQAIESRFDDISLNLNWALKSRKPQPK